MAGLIDRTGKRYDRLLVVSRAENGPSNQVRWNCICDCGKEIAVIANTLNRKKVSCGCRHRENATNLIKIKIGQRFGRLIVESRAKNDHLGNTRWNCICDCGKKTTVKGNVLSMQHTKSCGCLQKELNPPIHNNINGTNKQAFRTFPNKGSTTGILGVSLSNGKYRATIGFQGVCYSLGRYSTIEEAIQVRRHAESVLWGNFALSIKDENPELAKKIEKILNKNK